MTFIEILVATLRIVSGVLALYNAAWAFPGARRVISGNLSPPNLYIATVFWMAVAVLAFQAGYFAGLNNLWRVFCYAILGLTMAIAGVGHRMGAMSKARDFYRVFDHLAVGIAIVDLDVIDPDAAKELAAECRRRTALALARKMVNE